MKKIIYLFCCFLFPYLLYADNCGKHWEKKVTIFFLNGMFNPEDQARKSLKKLKGFFKDQLTNYEVEYELAYNQSENLYEQLKEVIRKKGNDMWSSLFHWLSGLQVAPSWLREKLMQIAKTFAYLEYRKDEDLQNHILQYQEVLKKCSKILMVAHSQGSFYANEAWDTLYDTRVRIYKMEHLPAIGLISLGSPAGRVGSFLKVIDDHESYTDYINLKNDYLVNAIRVIYPRTLDGNATNNNDPPEDWKHHAFTTYLNGDESGKQFLEKSQNILNNLQSPPPYIKLKLVFVDEQNNLFKSIYLRDIVDEPNSFHVRVNQNVTVRLKGIRDTGEEDWITQSVNWTKKNTNNRYKFDVGTGIDQFKIPFSETEPLLLTSNHFKLDTSHGDAFHLTSSYFGVVLNREIAIWNYIRVVLGWLPETMESEEVTRLCKEQTNGFIALFINDAYDAMCDEGLLTKYYVFSHSKFDFQPFTYFPPFQNMYGLYCLDDHGHIASDPLYFCNQISFLLEVSINNIVLMHERTMLSECDAHFCNNSILIELLELIKKYKS